MASVAQPHAPQPEQQKQQQESQDRDRQERRVTRARLVQRLVENSGDLPSFMHDLIHTQAVVVAGTEAAAFLIEAGSSGKPELRTVAHVRPDNVEDAVRRQAVMAFREIVTQCLAEDKDGALRVGGGNNASGEEVDPQFCLVTVLRQDDRPVAATAVITRCRDESRALQRLNTMQLVAGYFELFVIRKQHEQSRQVARTHQDVFQFASTVATAENFAASAAGLCNELAARAGAVRTAVGWVKGSKRVKLVAISHTEEFDKKQELSVQLVKVMEECLDQEEFVQFDPSGASTENVTREAMHLSQMEGGNRIVSVPLRRKDEMVGVMTLEFPPETPATPSESTALAVAAELLAPQLFDRYQNDRYLVTKTGLSVRDNTKKVFGLRQHTLAKVLILSTIGLLVFLTLYKPMYQVSGAFEFVPELQRIVDSPMEGQIAEVLVDIGDEVSEGDVIAVLNTDDLEKRKESALSQALTAQAQAVWIESRPDSPPSAAAEARAKSLEAESARLEADYTQLQIDKATIRSPIDGVVLQVPGQADLKERTGNVIRAGDPLVIVGQADDLKLQVRVADRDIDDVKVGQKGTLATAALPGVKVPVTVEKIIPAAAADQQSGSNAFTIIAVVDPEYRDEDWRNKATGEVRLDVAPRSLAWQWTHRAVDWVRLKLWL